MEYIGLLTEIAFLLLGVYLYLFSIGKVKGNDAKKSAEFHRANKGWLRILSIGLIAIMTINILLHINELMAA